MTFVLRVQSPCTDDENHRLSRRQYSQERLFDVKKHAEVNFFNKNLVVKIKIFTFVAIIALITIFKQPIKQIAYRENIYLNNSKI